MDIRENTGGGGNDHTYLHPETQELCDALKVSTYGASLVTKTKWGDNLVLGEFSYFSEVLSIPNNKSMDVGTRNIINFFMTNFVCVVR